MDLLRYQAELRRERPEDKDVRGYVGWISVGVMVGVVLCLASLAIPFATHSGVPDEFASRKGVRNLFSEPRIGGFAGEM